jgi:protein-S-isoprenylcysteine O-methyltransferase Ste14
MSNSKESKIRHLVETLISVFLFVFQYIPVAGPWYGLMIFPLITYISGLVWAYPDFLGAQINLLLFSERLMFGRIVAVTGFIIFLVAFVQFLRKKGEVITTGIYSIVRHPQYFGIVVMTLGISIMSIQFTWNVDPRVLYVWLIQVLGYALLAAYEERYLLGEHKTEYQQYKDKVPSIFPIPRLRKIPEPLVSMLISIIIAFLLTLL